MLSYLKTSDTRVSTLGRVKQSAPLRTSLQAVASPQRSSRGASPGRTTSTLHTTTTSQPASESPFNLSLTRLVNELRSQQEGGDSRGASPRGTSGGGALARLGWTGPTGVSPVGRGESIILEAALDEALPAGAITAKYQPAARAAIASVAAAVKAATEWSARPVCDSEAAAAQRPPSRSQTVGSDTTQTPQPTGGLSSPVQGLTAPAPAPQQPPNMDQTPLLAPPTKKAASRSASRPVSHSASQQASDPDPGPAGAIVNAPDGSLVAAVMAGTDLAADAKLLGGVLREAARQVAATCAERGRLLVKVGRGEGGGGGEGRGGGQGLRESTGQRGGCRNMSERVTRRGGG